MKTVAVVTISETLATHEDVVDTMVSDTIQHDAKEKLIVTSMIS